MRQSSSMSESLPDPNEVILPVLRPRRPREVRTPWNIRLAGRMARIASGLSFRQIATRTGANAETVRRYMRQGNPCVAFLKRFCRTFKVSADDLLGLAPRSSARPRPRRRAAKLAVTVTIRKRRRVPAAFGAGRSG